MRLIDSQFKTYFHYYFLQCLIATGVLVIILFILEIEAHLAIVVTLGASSFIVFAMPKTKQAQPRCLIGGHIVGLLSGGASYLPILLFHLPEGSKGAELLYIFMCAIAVGMAIFLMSITDTALGVVAQGPSWQAVIFVLSCALALSLVRYLLKAKLRNLM